MSHSQFHSIDLFILRHAWLNLWDKRMLLAESTRLLSFWEVCCIYRMRLKQLHWIWCDIRLNTIGVFRCIHAPSNRNQKKVSYVKLALVSHNFQCLNGTSSSRLIDPNSLLRLGSLKVHWVLLPIKPHHYIEYVPAKKTILTSSSNQFSLLRKTDWDFTDRVSLIV